MILYRLLALLVLFSLTGCSLVFNYNHVNVKSSTPGAQTAIDNKFYTSANPYNNKEWNSGSFEKHKKYGVFADSTITVLNKKTTPLFITQYKKGYLSRTTFLPANKRNFAKIFSCVTLLSMPFLILKADYFDNGIPVLVAFYNLYYGLWDVVFSTSRNYKYKEIDLPPMTPISKRKPSERYIEPDSITISCNVNSIPVSQKSRFYKYFGENYQFNKTYDYNTGVSNSEFASFISDTTISKLKEFNFINTSESPFEQDDYYTVKLSVVIKNIRAKIPQIQGGQITDVDVVFYLTNSITNDTVIAKEYTEGAIYSGDKYALKHSIAKSYIEDLENFLMDPDVRLALKSNDSLIAEQFSSWSTIMFNKEEQYCSTLKESTKAVVTIINGQSHGSACYISSDGYFLTAAHVVANNPNNIFIQLEDGSKIKCEVVRSNLKSDLALLRSTPIDALPLKIDFSDKNKPGNNVYAIGTPVNIELGQSISKGIISGKRKFNDMIALQTDVSISPGHSGGALLNEDKELIGIIGSKIEGNGLEGLGFAIPSIYFEETLRLLFSN